MLRFRLHPEAEREALSAVEWIKDEDPIQSDLFVAALKNAIGRARSNPEVYPKFSGEFRKVRVGKFTYAVVFRLRRDEIQIVAVMPHHRKPGYWKK